MRPSRAPIREQSCGLPDESGPSPKVGAPIHRDLRSGKRSGALGRPSQVARLVDVHGRDDANVVDEAPLALMLAAGVEPVGPEVLAVTGDVVPLDVFLGSTILGRQR